MPPLPFGQNSGGTLISPPACAAGGPNLTAARYGGTVRLTTTDPSLPGEVPPIAESVYVVHFDLRAELVEDDRAREITALDRLVDN
jgi:hypothetical protein